MKNPGVEARRLHVLAIARLLEETAPYDSFVKALRVYLLQQQSLVKWHLEPSSDHQAKALRGFAARGTPGAVAVGQGLANRSPGHR
jgi:hypothetical protein